MKRYDPEVEYRDNEAYPVMVEHDYGDYVSYEDYEDIADRLSDTEVELKWLKDKIIEIFQDM